MQKRQILINAIMSVIQIIVISIALFILYRFLLDTIGVEKLGIWALVIATSSVANIANFGLSGSVVKFVAKYVARKEAENVSEVIQTAVISVGILVGFILLVGYPFIKWVLSLVMENNSLHLALSILPYALAALWIMSLTSIFQSGLDGYQRIDLRSLLLIGGELFHLFLCFILAPPQGLMGIAYARVITNFSVLFCSWLLIRKYLPMFPIFPYKWNKALFKEILPYGVNFQVISITNMLYDPATKALLSKFGGLSMVGYYEMASRMIRQIRSLIVSANQVLVPAIADLKERIPEKIHVVYQKSYQLLFYLSVPLFSLIIISLPFISIIWIGRYEKIFVVFGILLTIGWFLNILNAPAYFAYLGIGDLRWNVIGHIVIGLLNIFFAIILGFHFGGVGVVVGWVISLVLGSSVIYLSYHIKNKIPLIEVIPKKSRWVASFCVIGVIATLLIQKNIHYYTSGIILNISIILLFSIIIFIPFWLHPMRKQLIGWVMNDLINKGFKA